MKRGGSRHILLNCRTSYGVERA
jgi:hypothetical protein